MTVEAKALVDLASEQTSAAGTDLLFVESAGTPSKITKANMLGANLTAYADLAPLDLVNGEATAIASLIGQSSVALSSLSADVAKIEVYFDLSLPTTENVLIQLSVGASWITTGYESSSSGISTAVNTARSTSGFVYRCEASGIGFSGSFTLRRIPETNRWFSQHSGVTFLNAATVHGHGTIVLGGDVDGVRIISAGGSNFSTGNVTFITR